MSNSVQHSNNFWKNRSTLINIWRVCMSSISQWAFFALNSLSPSRSLSINARMCVPLPYSTQWTCETEKDFEKNALWRKKEKNNVKNIKHNENAMCNLWMCSFFILFVYSFIHSSIHLFVQSLHVRSVWLLLPFGQYMPIYIYTIPTHT